MHSTTLLVVACLKEIDEGIKTTDKINGYCDLFDSGLLNREAMDDKKEVLQPEFFVLPVEKGKQACQMDTSWNRVHVKGTDDINQYREHWDMIDDFLSVPPTSTSQVTDNCQHPPH
jgi:hypothetical protein